jgi:hypothetical protein
VDGGVAAAVPPRHVAQLEDVLAHRATSVGLFAVTGWDSGGAAPGGALAGCASQWVKPARLRLNLEDHRLVDEQPGVVGRCVGLRLQRVCSRNARRAAVRWAWMTLPTSTPNVVSAIASLIAGASRGRR